MSQQPDGYAERRSEVRRSAAFAFRFSNDGKQRSGWMLNLSSGGAAFLVAAPDAPRVGQRLELAEMPSANRSVREAAETLPKCARVVRVDDPDTATRRVAVRFELAVSGALGGNSGDGTHMRQGHPRTVSAVPPLSLLAVDPGATAQPWQVAGLPVQSSHPMS